MNQVEPNAVERLVGLGLDLIEVARIEQAESRWGRAFTERIFTPVESTEAGSGALRAQRLASRFAAKEAVFKSLGSGPPKLGWREVEIRRGPGGMPLVQLSGRAEDHARSLGVVRVLVTITHLEAVAGAGAVALGMPVPTIATPDGNRKEA